MCTCVFCKAFTTRVQVFCTRLWHNLYTFFVRLLQHLYKCCCQAFRAFVQVCVARLLQQLYKWFWKVVTACVHVFLKGFYSICTSVCWKAFTAVVQVCVKGFYSICTMIWDLFLQGVLHSCFFIRFFTRIWNSYYKAFARLLQSSHYKELYNKGKHTTLLGLFGQTDY